MQNGWSRWHSPINYAQWSIVCPQYQITSLPTVQEVVGQVWTGTARTPARYAGIRQTGHSPSPIWNTPLCISSCVEPTSISGS